MRDLPIAYGNSCYAKTWANKTTAWEDLCERLKNTIRTTETVEEYPKLKKDDRDRAKDKGGFVGGYLKGNRRKRETVVCRSMLTMDADHAEIGFIDRFASECRYQATLRSTVDNAEDILVRYRAEEMCLLIDEIGKITEFSYPLMLKTLDRVVVNINGKLTFIFQSGIKITV